MRHYLHVDFADDFWQSLPDDCIGACLKPDGYIKLPDPKDYWRITPLAEPLVIMGRPELDADHDRGKPHVVNAGGIPIISDRLLETLRGMGAKGQTADVIYRGFNMAAHDTVQEGYKRFLVEPQYNMDAELAIDVLPKRLIEDFDFCCLLRTRGGEAWYEIGLARSKAVELRKRRRTVLMTPIFRYNGAMHEWLQNVESGVRNLHS